MQRIVHDAKTGDVEYIEVTEEWLLDNRSDRLQLVLDQNVIEALDGEALLTLQLVNSLGKNRRQRFDAKVQIDDFVIPVTGNGNGKATIPIMSVEAGIFEITVLNMPSNTIELEVT